jgi:hypothetical protein
MDLFEKVNLNLPLNVFKGQILIDSILNVDLQLIRMLFFELINLDCSLSLLSFESYYSQTPLNRHLNNFFIIGLWLLNFFSLKMMMSFPFLVLMVTMIYELHSKLNLFNLSLNLFDHHDQNLSVLYL